jgi:hypothetical protein
MAGPGFGGTDPLGPVPDLFPVKPDRNPPRPGGQTPRQRPRRRQPPAGTPNAPGPHIDEYA